jgi:hypothetical protein
MLRCSHVFSHARDRLRIKNIYIYIHAYIVGGREGFYGHERTHRRRGHIAGEDTYNERTHTMRGHIQ